MFETTVALALLRAVLTVEADYLLDSYAECLRVAKGERERCAIIELVHQGTTSMSH